MAVPQDFVVAIQSNIDYSQNRYKGVWIRGDVEPTRIRTAENTRSEFVYVLNSGQAVSTYLDSNITPAGFTEPVYSNLYVTAYISYSTAAVAMNNQSNTVHIFPNPTSSTLNFQCQNESANFKLFDLLGREILNGKIDKEKTIDLRNFPTGNYKLIFYESTGIVTSSLIIQH